MKSVLVLGIGNTLLGDEGAGIHTLHYLARHFENRSDIDYLDGGTLSFTLATRIEAARKLIVIDAAQLSAEPGSVRCFVGAEMDDFVGKAKRSVHEVGLKDLMDIARLTGSMPDKRALVGIQPEYIGWSDNPSTPVERAIPVAAEKVISLVRQWDESDSIPSVHHAGVTA